MGYPFLLSFAADRVVLMSDVIGAILASTAFTVVRVPKLEKRQSENVGVNIWFFISGASIVLITAIILLCYRIEY